MGRARRDREALAPADEARAAGGRRGLVASGHVSPTASAPIGPGPTAGTGPRGLDGDLPLGPRQGRGAFTTDSRGGQADGVAVAWGGLTYDEANACQSSLQQARPTSWPRGAGRPAPDGLQRRRRADRGARRIRLQFHQPCRLRLDHRCHRRTSRLPRRRLGLDRRRHRHRHQLQPRGLGSGFGAGHKVIAGYDFADKDSNPDATTWQHGTAVAGLIASSDAAHLGVAPGADLVALRVFGDDNQGASTASPTPCNGSSTTTTLTTSPSSIYQSLTIIIIPTIGSRRTAASASA